MADPRFDFHHLSVRRGAVSVPGEGDGVPAGQQDSRDHRRLRQAAAGVYCSI